jgi:hypothetical protein
LLRGGPLFGRLLVKKIYEGDICARDQVSVGDAAYEYDLAQKRSGFCIASSSMGRLGSGIDLFSEKFDRKVSFARSTASNRIAKRQDTIEF